MGGFFPGMSSGKGVGALDAFAAASLRDTIFSAASEAHADAAAVLAEAPPNTIFLRPSPGGDGGDLETHVAVALFWGMRRREREARASSEPSAAPSEAPEAPEEAPASRATVAVTSRLGLKRALTATELAFIIAERVATDDRARRLLVDARVAPGDSGVVRLTTAAHHDARRRDGFLRCKLCGRFVAGERALWWHSKTKHGIKHAEAADDATNESRALFVSARAHEEPYRDVYSRANATREDSDPGSKKNESPNRRIGPVVSVRAPSDLAAGLAAARRGDETALAALVASGKVEALADPGLDAARRGDARALRALVLEGKWDPRVARDRHGAGALLWSAGAGHLACVRLLCEEALAGREPLDPNDPATHQGGRRAYRGRTALHWAARNGHLDVVRYLVTEKNADVDARTFEGTTAFGWAVWRGRLEVARWLVEQGKCAFAAVNTFGCNAAMWCAQGAEEERDEREAKSAFQKSETLAGPRDPPANSDELANSVPPTAAYVASLGVSFRPINANGHSAVHKAAQRGRREMCAFLLGRRWPRGLDAPRGRDANENENEKEKKEARARSLVDANHLRRDDEGFRPSDLARLAGDAKLHAWLAAEEKAHDEEEADAETRGGLAEETRARDATVSYAFYPPTTFYGAASLGDVSLLSRVLREDVYELNDDIAGVGSVLHVAVARGHAALVAAALRGDFGERADVNRKSAGAFGLTPLHIAATLFTRREAHARAERALASAEAELERLNARDPRDPRDPRACDGLHAADGVKHSSRSKKQARREEKSEVKKARRDAHGKAAEARKVLAVDAAGARDAVRIYRLLLQAGADTRAVAKVPAKFVFAGTEAAATKEKAASNGTNRLISAAPRDLAGGAAAAELAALELEVAEAPPALFHVSRHVCSSSEIQANGERTVLDDDGRRRTSRFVRRDPTTKKNGTRPASDDGNPTRLFRAGVAEAEARRVTRAEVPGVPGAFILDNVLGVEACASLCAFVDSLVDGAATEKGAKTKARNAPRRESAASRAERLALAGVAKEKEKGLEGLETLFARVTRDPLSLVAATTTPDGTTHHPVEPTNWDVPAEALRELAARCRPFLPWAGKETTARGEEAFAASLAPAGFELATRLRCYRYDPGTASPPHFDKAGPGPVVDGRETSSGYSVVLYLNGDDLVADASLGGETTFFRPLGDRDVAKSRRGFTIAVGDGAAPLTRVSARVRARTGAALFFPHGTVSGCFESPLHEGSAMRGDAAKYVLRTDVCYFARSEAR